MKTLILTTALIFSVNMISSHPDNGPYQNEDKYCAKLKDGKITVVHEGSPIAADVMLGNGTKIKSDGTVINKDGTSFVLKEGECVDKSGALPSRK